MAKEQSSRRGWSIPLWISIPVVLGLWLSTWISSMDPTGSFQDSYILWGVTFAATAMLVMMRPVRA